MRNIVATLMQFGRWERIAGLKVIISRLLVACRLPDGLFLLTSFRASDLKGLKFVEKVL
jgi:hypothetical protein